MKILVANKFYYPRGGDCICTLELEKLLKENGHEVAIFSMQHPDNIKTSWNHYFPTEVKFTLDSGAIETILRPFGTQEVKRKFTQLLDDFKPEIVHLHNIHTQLSPVIAEIAHKRKIRVIWTFHDYKLMCSRSDCLRNNVHCCNLCQNSKWNIIRNKCIKNSLLASYLGLLEAFKWNKEKINDITDAFICPSIFMQKKIETYGINKAKLFQIHNFVDSNKAKRSQFEKEDYYCYIGRLSVEKGVETLISAAKKLPYTLKIIGSGPLLEVLQEKSKNDNIEFVGYKQWAEIKEIVGKARFSVIPSEWYENNPLSVIESLCLGTPVLGANIGGIPELLIKNELNSLFASGDVFDLKAKIKRMWTKNNREADYKELAESSQLQFSTDIYYKKLMKIYNQDETVVK